MAPTNVFVLSTGRCGSTTFARACGHIRNFSSAHESLSKAVGADRLAYPARHIEVDNRLSWLLGRLSSRFPDDVTFYVHLWRNDEATARSFEKRWRKGIIRAYAKDILRGAHRTATPYDVCLDYCRTVNTNIEAFLMQRPNTMKIRLRDAAMRFPEFWERIGAEGDLAAALCEWERRHNAS